MYCLATRTKKHVENDLEGRLWQGSAGFASQTGGKLISGTMI